MGSVLRQRRMEPIYGWRVGLLSRRGLHVGFCLSLGMDTIPLRLMAIRSIVRMGLATRRLHRRVWFCPSYRCSGRLSETGPTNGNTGTGHDCDGTASDYPAHGANESCS